MPHRAGRSDSMWVEELLLLAGQLGEDDSHIARQVCAIIYRYLEKRGRLESK